MKIVATLISVLLWLLGGIFLLAAAHPEAVSQGKTIPRIIVGAVLLAGGAILLYFGWKKSPGRAEPGPGGTTNTIEQGVPGELSLKAMTCPHCGAQVDSASTSMKPEGTLVVTCNYCGGTFMVQEEPKW